MTTLTDIKLDIVFKKSFGLATAFPAQSIIYESVINKPAIYSSQIFQLPIPTTAPTDLTPTSFNSANAQVITGKTPTKQTSTAYNYIVKYGYLPLKDATGGSNKKVSYYYDSTSNNLLKYSIPDKYDSTTSTYAITVYDKDGNPIASDNATNPWVLDNDSGVLTFISTANGYQFSIGPPSITFWRYEGTFGVGGMNSASTTSASTTFTGATASTSTTTGTIILNGTSAGIGVAGNINAGGYIAASSFNATSDYRIKDNVLPLTNTFIVDNLRPVHYYNKISKGNDIGLIAHELQEHYPNLVSGEKDGENYQSVNYIGLIPILINEIQTMKKEIKKLREELDELHQST